MPPAPRPWPVMKPPSSSRGRARSEDAAVKYPYKEKLSGLSRKKRRTDPPPLPPGHFGLSNCTSKSYNMYVRHKPVIAGTTPAEGPDEHDQPNVTDLRKN